MSKKKSVLCFVLVLTMVGAISAAQAQDIASIINPSMSDCKLPPQNGVFEDASGFHADLGVKKFINSFCSYQFPGAPGSAQAGTDPLSRLESPLDQWFLGVQLSQVYGSLTFRTELWTNLNRESGLKFQDSDWEFPDNPGQKTTFSESNSRMEKGNVLDLNAEWTAPAVSGAGIRPVVGFRWQYFRFLFHDGFQAGISGGFTGPLVGDIILNTYTFKDFYVGTRSYLNWAGFRLILQGDYGLIDAQNFDHHLMRGELGGPTRGKGSSWHIGAIIATSVSDRLNLRLEADFRRLVAKNCSLEDHDETGAITATWGGAKIWSDQQSITAYGELRF